MGAGSWIWGRHLFPLSSPRTRLCGVGEWAWRLQDTIWAELPACPSVTVERGKEGAGRGDP